MRNLELTQGLPAMCFDVLSDSSMMTQMTSLHEQRLDCVHRQLKAAGARRVLDLGCGSGALLARLLNDKQFDEVVGLETSGISLVTARSMLGAWLGNEQQRPSLTLVRGSYTESQRDLVNFDAAAMVETIEHVRPNQLSLVERSVFAQMAPRLLVMTTPNREYNPLLGLGPGEFREQDHKFEWDRAKFALWCRGIASRNRYTVQLGGIGEADPELGPPTQTAVFRRLY